jgi:Domain of unknown function (DUF4189)
VLRKGVLLVVLLLVGVGPARATNYGAVAFDQDSLAFGYSYNWGSQQQADAAALRKCNGNCKVIGKYWNNCGSLAAANDGSYGWDANLDEDLATSRALANCNRYGTGCETKVTVCNDESQPVQSSPSGNIQSPIGRHGCWSANWSRIPGCKD